MKKYHFVVAVLIFWISILPKESFSQLNLSGKITMQEDGTSLPGATIVVDRGLLSAISQPDGTYHFSDIAPGKHRVAVSYIGYKTINEEFQMTKNLSLNFQLRALTILQDEVIVESTRVDAQTPASYSMVDAGDIEKQNLGADLPFLLQMTPSVVTTSDAGAGVGYTGMRIRGTDMSRINVTLNGVPVNDAESHSVYFVDLPDLASSVDNIQIQRGVGTSTNGAAAFGASINIQSASFHPEPYAEYNVAAGSFNTLKNTARFGTGLIDGKWIVEGRLSNVSSDGYIDRSSSDLSSFYFTAGYYGDRSILKAIITSGKEKTYQAWYGIPKDSLETNRRYNPSGVMRDESGNISGYYDNQTDNYQQDYYQLHYALRVTDHLNLTSALFYTKGKGYYESYRNMDAFSKYGISNLIIGGDTITATNLIRQKWLDNNFYGANLGFNYEANKLKLTLGGGLNRYEGDHYGKIIWAQFFGNIAPNQPWYQNTGTKTDGNVFAKMNYPFMKNLNAYVDVQYRTIQYAISGIHDDLRDLTQHHSFHFFNPKAGLYYSFNPQSSVWASVAVANREPNRSVYRDADPGQQVLPERLMDFESGYKIRAESVSFETDVFFMNYKDQLVLTGQINNVGDAILVNVPKSYRAGVEVIAAWQFSRQFNLSVNATYSQNKIRNFVSYTDNWDTWPEQNIENLGTSDISFSPELVAGGIFTWKLNDQWNANLLTNYVGKQYIDNTSNDARSLDAYLINNIRINYSIETKLIRQIDFLLSLNNIFNVEYESNAWVYRYYTGGNEYEMNGYFPQAKFNFMAGVNFKF